MRCRSCSFENPQGFHFCGRCGTRLADDAEENSGSEGLISERKNVTILFSDLSDYTRITEIVDPEEIQTLMAEIFEQSRRIIETLGGTVERFLGDEIMAVFGNPIAHEDDAVRAVNAARQIHRMVEGINTRGLIAHPLKMHTGINTGIVVTNEDPFNPLSLGVTGDAANLAKRIQAFADPGTIVVGRETYRQTVGYFNFESLAIQPVKGRREAVSIYRYLGARREPRKVRRILGRRADLIAREKELAAFDQAVAALAGGSGGIVCVSGDAGTGKSRLAEAFRHRQDAVDLLWCEGYAYEFTRNTSYFPFIDLLRREFGIVEEDAPTIIRQKIQHQTARWTINPDLAAILGGLFALESQDRNPADLIDPEQWKANLHRTMALLLDAMAFRKPLIVCLEDLHWADPSSIDLLRSLFYGCRGPILFLLLFRPDLAEHYPDFQRSLEKSALRLPIGDLEPQEGGRLVCSLLGTGKVPDCLRSFIQKEVPGNPFFLEEVINALIETETLVPAGDTWELNRPLEQVEVALSVRALIASRIDRLEPDAKSLLREASVIGGTFPKEILHVISHAGDRFEACLDDLVSMDLIRPRRDFPAMEYAFKHALIREVVYDGILKAERRAIHARIALSIEKLFGEHLPEHFETLAFHFKHGNTIDKAITYLMFAGRKSLRRYAVEESHRYFREAFNLISHLNDREMERDERLIEILTHWFPVYYYRGRFGAAERRMQGYLDLADTITNNELRGMFYIGYGMCLWARERFKAAYDYVQRALAIGRTIDSRRVEGYAHAWLTWVCIELGRPAEALAHGEAARSMANHFDSGHYPYYRSLDSDGFAFWLTGDSQQIRHCGRALRQLGKANPGSRIKTWTRFVVGLGQLSGGAFSEAADSMREALKTAADPLYSMFPKLFLAIATLSAGDPLACRATLREVLEEGRRCGCEVIGSPAELFLSIARCADGNMRKQVGNIHRLIRHWEANGALWRQLSAEFALGEFYLNLRRRETAVRPGVILRNLPFLVTALPLAARRAESHYRHVIAVAQEIGAGGLQGQAYFGLSRLYHHQGRHDAAVDAVDRALERFEAGKADAFIRSARQLKAAIEAQSAPIGRPSMRRHP